jgi:hypothetical protein
MRTVYLPLPSLPKSLESTYAVQTVRVLDRIRRELEDKDVERFGEFCWFAREYPRIFRHHVDHAAYRLRAIHGRYVQAYNSIRSEIEAGSNNLLSHEVGDLRSRSTYFDFEAFLNAVGASLDALARVVGTAYKEQTPPAFNKLCGKAHLGGCAEILREAKAGWVQKLKDYRDCFVHYTPVDTLLCMGMSLRSNGWEFRCKLPTNPNCREILRFRYSRRTELFRYALSVWRNLTKLDRRIADEIGRKYNAGEYPARIEHLFFIGARGG